MVQETADKQILELEVVDTIDDWDAPDQEGFRKMRFFPKTEPDEVVSYSIHLHDDDEDGKNVASLWKVTNEPKYSVAIMPYLDKKYIDHLLSDPRHVVSVDEIILRVKGMISIG